MQILINVPDTLPKPLSKTHQATGRKLKKRSGKFQEKSLVWALLTERTL
jgi:hypothetical protein